ncbi:MAG: RluA family pseudouridine synthase [Acidobacteriota bacterium]
MNTTWRVDSENAGERLDRHVAHRLDIPRNQIQQWIADQRITVNGVIAKASTRLEDADEVVCRPPPPSTDAGVVAEPGQLDLLYEDEHLIVVDKPAGLSVHPGAGRERGTLANRLLDRFPEIAGVGGSGRPGIVHRLDLDTTGVLVVARSVIAYRRLSEAFADRHIDKRYLAVVWGMPRDASGTVDLAIGRHPQDRKRMTVRHDGRPALTHWTVESSVAGVSVLRIKLETGRTHQIRVHLKAIRHPLIGDPVYGEARWREVIGRPRAVLRNFPRPALHAHRLSFEHPVDERPLSFSAPIPDDLQTLWHDSTGQDWPIASP